MLSGLLPNIASINPIKLVNLTERITILYIVILTPASTSLVFDRQGAT